MFSWLKQNADFITVIYSLDITKVMYVLSLIAYLLSYNRKVKSSKDVRVL